MQLTITLREILDKFQENSHFYFWCYQIEEIFEQKNCRSSSNCITSQLHTALCELYPEIFPPELDGLGVCAERWVSDDTYDKWEKHVNNEFNFHNVVRSFRIWLAGQMRANPEMLDRPITFNL